jgi:hypothetical protein
MTLMLVIQSSLWVSCPSGMPATQCSLYPILLLSLLHPNFFKHILKHFFKNLLQDTLSGEHNWQHLLNDFFKSTMA